MASDKDPQLEAFRALPHTPFTKPDPCETILYAEKSMSFRGRMRYWVTESDDDTLTLVCALRAFKIPYRFPEGAAFQTKKGNIHWRRPFEHSQLEKVNRYLEQVSTHTRPQAAMGLDGTSYQLTLPNAGGEITFDWWQEPPEGLEPLDDIICLLDSLSGIDL